MNYVKRLAETDAECTFRFKNEKKKKLVQKYRVMPVCG